jgi:hypothetical protein
LKFIKFAFICWITLLTTQWASAQSQMPANESVSNATEETARPKNEKSFGNLMLKLGKGLLNEVTRRLNLEEAEIITIKKDTLANGGQVFHVDTGKFSFDIRKRSKTDKDDQTTQGSPPRE